MRRMRIGTLESSLVGAYAELDSSAAALRAMVVNRFRCMAATGDGQYKTANITVTNSAEKQVSCPVPEATAGNNIDPSYMPQNE